MDRRTPADFYDDSIRPDQHYTAGRSGPIAEGERRLMVAILEDALLCARAVFRKGGTQGDPDLEEAMEWLADDDEDYIFSFGSICRYLEIRPQDIHAKLDRLRWTERRRRGDLPREILARAAGQSGNPVLARTG